VKFLNEPELPLSIPILKSEHQFTDRVETLLDSSLSMTAEHLHASVTVNVKASSNGHKGRSCSSASVISALNEMRSTACSPIAVW